MRCSFNIWAYKAAAKAIERHIRHKRSKAKLHGLNGMQMTSDTPRTSIDSPAQSPITTAPSSRVPSILDLRHPIITSNTAKLANATIIDDGDLESEASSSDTSDNESVRRSTDEATPPTGIVTVSGTEPLFREGNIVAERVSTHGNIRPFDPVNPALDPALRKTIGQVRGDGAIQKWLLKRKEWDEKYASQLAKWRKIREEDRIRGAVGGYLTRDLQGENPPLSALVRWWDTDLARKAGKSVDEVGVKENRGIGMWTKMSSKVSRAKRVRQG